MPSKVWDEITNGCNYLSMLGLNLSLSLHLPMAHAASPPKAQPCMHLISTTIINPFGTKQAKSRQKHIEGVKLIQPAFNISVIDH